MSFKIIGTGCGLPKVEKTNKDLSLILNTSDEWIKKRTGIEKRRILTDECLWQIALKAGKDAILNANINKQDVDLVICATCTPDYATPSVACIVAGELGLTCGAFDINAACSGFVYGLDVATGFLARKRAKNILLIACEEMSRIVDWTDRSTAVLFGDGAAAVLLSQGENLIDIKITSSGNTKEIGARNKKGNCPYKNINANFDIANEYFYMNGSEIYKFAVHTIINDINSLLKDNNIEMKKVKYIIPHQANIRIIQTAIDRLRIDKNKIVSNIEKYGNTSSVGVPLLLDELNKQKKLVKDDIILLTTFGAGLTTGSCLIKW